MSLSNIQLNNSFKSKKVVKVIAGINNANISQIIRVAKATQLSGASYLDINANIMIVKLLKSFLSIPSCVSSINPIDIYNCVASGADLVEIGNYDVFYKKNIYITAKQLINLVKEIKFLIGDVDICVTIPSHMNLDEQVNFAKQLEYLDIDIIQTEGLFFNNKSKNLCSLTSYLLLSLLSTYVISHNVNIPVITSSGMLGMFSNIPLYYGASGLGFSSIIRQKNNVIDMVDCINEIKYCMNNALNVKKQFIYMDKNHDLFININRDLLTV
uniref:Uncharacterized protein ycf23 n=1 Tax=Herposiphonia versicolor TaxID=2007163 RepID=A0A1Z1MFI2_9FLOR|nr:hypothetical protein [Herposiphonia versicolor]ARW64726.1 hypothetical protein [Herposiphonia versicolor]